MSDENYRGPTWIIATTSPGSITGNNWIQANSRDPIRHQFEITREGMGSGIYGYRIGTYIHDDYSMVSANKEMSIAKGVAISGAFFDDNQSVKSQQPGRFEMDAFQHFFNVTWFSEIPNYNVAQQDRNKEAITPYPFYLTAWTTKDELTPFIHLQDGGNSDNAAIFPLLRRGYQTIIYSHGTQDDKADFEAICHLKNHLEVDGVYALTSEELESVVGNTHENTKNAYHFRTYLEQLCTEQLDESDLAAFPDDRNGALSRLVCNRLIDDQGRPATSASRCDYFFKKFPSVKMRNDEKVTPQLVELYPKRNDLMYSWPPGQPLIFRVYRTTVDASPQTPLPREKWTLLSTIYTALPAIPDWQHVNNQLVITGKEKANPVGSWTEYLALTNPMTGIKYCEGPGDFIFSRDGDVTAKHPYDLPCTSLSYILESLETLKSKAIKDGHPVFPQDNFIVQTIHSTYTQYAAYFDLGRHQARAVVRTLSDDKK